MEIETEMYHCRKRGEDGLSTNTFTVYSTGSHTIEGGLGEVQDKTVEG